MKQLFGVPGYSRWLSGRAVSWFGDTLMFLVLSMWVKKLTDSNAMAGLTFMFFALPQLLAPLAGFLVDRWEHRRVLVAGNLLSVVVLLPLFLVKDAGDTWIIWAVAVGYGVSGVILPAASVAMMRSIVPEDFLPEANGIQQTIGTSFQLICPALGAAMFALWSGAGPTMVAIGLFVVAAIIFATFRYQLDVESVDQDQGLWHEMSAGFRHIWRHKVVFHGLVAVMIMQFAGGFFEGSVYSVTDTFHLAPEWAGAIASTFGVGMLGGALVAGKLVRRFGEVPVMSTSMALSAVTVFLTSLAPAFWVGLVCAALVGATMAPTQVAFGTLYQKATPAGLMGRVGAAIGPLFALVIVGSLATGAMLVAVWSFRPIFQLMAAIMLLAAGYLAVTLRRTRRSVPPRGDQ